MIQPPTILIGVSKKKMNRLLHSKNEIYYYVINDTLRKVFCTLFDALGNISSRNDYYSFIKKYVQFKPFSKCNTPNLLRHPLSIKQCMVIAIDNITRELYLPSQHEFDCISLRVNYPTLIPEHNNDFIKDIVEEHYTKQYKNQLQNVFAELQHKSSMKPVLNEICNVQLEKVINKKAVNEIREKINTLVHKSYMNVVLNEMIEKNRKKQCRDQLQKVLNMLIHKSSMKPVLTEIKKVNVSKVEVEADDEDYEKYEDDFEIDFAENDINNEYEYTLQEDSELDFVKEELDEGLESVVDELKEVMTLAIQSLPKAKPVSYPPTIVIDEENEDTSFSASSLKKDEENDDFLIKSDAQSIADDTLFSASSLRKDEENEEKEEEFVVQKVTETLLDKSLPSKVEFIEVKETEANQEEALEEAVEKAEAVLEEAAAEAAAEAVAEEKVEEAEMDDVEEISKEEFEPLKSSTLVNDLFEKYQKDTKPEEEVKKPEPPKSYLGTMWSYLGWKSK
jgi:hypothetical protein